MDKILEKFNRITQSNINYNNKNYPATYNNIHTLSSIYKTLKDYYLNNMLITLSTYNQGKHYPSYPYASFHKRN